MSKVWQKIAERSGDANLGATLIRLAKAAEQMHQAEHARRLTTQWQRHGTALKPRSPLEEDVNQGPVYMEVDR